MKRYAVSLIRLLSLAAGMFALVVIPVGSVAQEQQKVKQPQAGSDVVDSHTLGGVFSSGEGIKENLWVTDNAAASRQTVPLSGTSVAARCIPIGGSCSGSSQLRCCPAPFPHHSFCSGRTGFGVCLMN